MNHEEPTLEFRQVRHKTWARTDMGQALDYVYYTIQQKWIIYPDKVLDSCAAQWSTFREEWRDLPIVDAKDIK